VNVVVQINGAPVSHRSFAHHYAEGNRAQRHQSSRRPTERRSRLAGTLPAGLFFRRIRQMGKNQKRSAAEQTSHQRKMRQRFHS
jgi:hypothetical protein